MNRNSAVTDLSICGVNRPERRVPFASFSLGLLFAMAVSMHAANVPAGFTETVLSGPTGGNWNDAVGLTFETNGRMYVWERTGKVWFKDTGDASYTLLLNISEEVGAWEDHGMLGFTLDPNFRVNGYLYLLYVVDRHHLLNFGTLGYNPSSNQYNAATIGRVTRYTCTSSSGFRSVDLGSRLVLIGETKQTGFPILSYTHGVGSLVFGEDGTLLVSCGDGGTADTTDQGGIVSGSYAPQGLADGIIRAKENIGALRSQLVDCLNGKVVRIDPATGDAVPSNPYYEAGNPRSARSRVWVLGLRNPFRMELKPESGSHNPADGNPGVLYLGDVGWNTWECLRVLTEPGQNSGWPLYEGLSVTGNGYDGNVANQDAPNPLYPASGCSQYFTFADLLKADTLAAAGQPPFDNPCNPSQKIPSSIPQFLHTRPVLDWNHSSTTTRTPTYGGSGQATTANVGAGGSPVTGIQFQGNCAVGGTWYTGTNFPAAYQDRYYFADWGQGLIKTLTFNTNHSPVALGSFASSAGAVVSLAQHPLDGSLYYISYNFAGATMQKLGFTGNRSPVAVASVNTNYGPTPLTVQLSSSGSGDPDGQAITYSWNFGDGTPVSTQANPAHTYSAPAGVPTKYVVTLTVTDSGGLSAQTTLIMSLNNTPPDVAITSPVDGTLYSPSNPTLINLSAMVSDAQSNEGQLLYEWQVLFHHNDHDHGSPPDTNHVTSAVIEPTACDGINIYYYRIRLTVTDPAGLVTTREVRLFPDCGPNMPPTISDIPNQSTTQNVPTAAAPFTIGDAEVAAANLQLSASSSNPALVPAGNIVFGGGGSSRTVTVTPASGQMGTATITVTVSDGPTNASDSFVQTVNPGVPGTKSFTNAAAITIPSVGNATPYPSTINVAGLGGAVSNLTVTLRNMSHTYPADVDVLLVGPGGQKAMIFSDVGGGGDVNSVTVTLSDAAATALTATGQIGSGTYRPTNVEPGENGNLDTFPAPAPAGPYAAPLSAFTGQPADGTWSLYAVDDGAGDQGSFAGGWSLTITTVGGGPAAPTITDIPDQSTTVNTATGAIPFTIADSDTPITSLTLGKASSNLALVPTNNIVFGGSGSNRTVTVTPATGQTGVSTITVTVSDGTNTASDTFLLTVNAVNTPPTIGTIPNQSIDEDTTTGPIGFTIGDAETATGSLTLSKSSSNSPLVPTNNIVFGGSGANRTVTVTPAANQSGAATITVTVSDGQYSANTNFAVTVNAVNDAPTISNLPDQTTTVNTPTAAIPFTISDAETAAGSLTVNGDSSHQTLVPSGNIMFGGSGANRTVTVTPAAGQTGSATITITVNDGLLTTNDTFVLTVSAQPIGLVAAYAFNEGTGTAVTDNSGNGNGGAIGTATWTTAGKYSNALIFNGSSARVTVNDSTSLDLTTGMTLEAWVYPTAGGGWRDVIYKGADDLYYLMGSSDTGSPAVGGTFASPLRGTTSLPLNTWTHLTGTYDGATLRLFTNGVQVASRAQTGAIQTSTAALTIGGDALYGQYFAGRIDEVRLYNRALNAAEIQADMNTPVGGTPPSQPPTISNIADQTTTVNTPTAAIPFTIADSDTPVASLTLGGGSSNTSLVPTNNVAFGGSGSNRTVTVTPAAGQTGTVAITVIVSDGTNSASDTFLLTVNAVNTPPTISGIASSVISEDNTTGPVAFTIGDAETAAGSLTLGKGSSDLTLVPVNSIVFGGSGSNRTVTVTPAANQNGSATITVTVSDGQYSAGTNFTVTVNAVNDAPTVSGIANQAIGVDSTTGPLSFTVGDVETAAGSLAVSGGSSDLALVPNGNIVFGGSGSNRTVMVTPAAGQSGTATIMLTVSDGQLNASNSFVLTVSALVTGTRSFTNSAAITIRVTNTASLYPSTIDVFGMGGTVSNVTVTLRGLSHTRPDDIDMLLVGPGGQKAIIFADAGGANILTNITVTLSGAASSSLPNGNRINSATYRPANYSPADTFPSPAPAAPYSGALSAFNGQTPNGAWSLYIFDDLAGGSGSLSAGWSLTMTTSGAAASNPVTLPSPITITSVTFIDPVRLRLTGIGDANQTYTVETSPDLLQWESLGQTTADAGGAFEFVDDLAGGSTERFYRVAMP